jgi:hypothetical protein
MLSSDPLERLSHVLVNLGLFDAFEAGELTVDDTMKVIKCIRGADKWAVAHGESPFPWPDEEIRNRLIEASRKQGGARWWATAFKRRAEAMTGGQG